MSRISIEDWAMNIARETAKRSQDPDRKVGAVALNHDNRIIATAYNGLMPHFVPEEGFWNNREARRPFMIHAETNLCSLLKRMEAFRVFLTDKPCSSCLKTLLAHGIERIFYEGDYPDPDTQRIADFYKITLKLWPRNQ